MIRKIVKIIEDKCNGCGLCITACHEGALQLVDGKAKLISDVYCDGLGACLPDCPTDAIFIEEREADAFDEELVKQHIAKQQPPSAPAANPSNPPAGGCPGSRARTMERPATATASPTAAAASELRQWPCQIKLVPVHAPYFTDAHLLIAADCTAYAYANIHQDFMRNKITLIGCPKLDEGDYADKLAAIISSHNLKSITLLRMEVPCCGGLEQALKAALSRSGKLLPWRVVIIGTDGTIIED